MTSRIPEDEFFEQVAVEEILYSQPLRLPRNSNPRFTPQ